MHLQIATLTTDPERSSLPVPKVFVLSWTPRKPTFAGDRG